MRDTEREQTNEGQEDRWREEIKKIGRRQKVTEVECRQTETVRQSTERQTETVRQIVHRETKTNRDSETEYRETKRNRQ